MQFSRVKQSRVVVCSFALRKRARLVRLCMVGSLTVVLQCKTKPVECVCGHFVGHIYVYSLRDNRRVKYNEYVVPANVFCTWLNARGVVAARLQRDDGQMMRFTASPSIVVSFACVPRARARVL